MQDRQRPTSLAEIPMLPALVDRIMENMIANPVAWLALSVSIVSAGLTIWRSRRDFRRQSSHDYLNAATALLERAFELFDKSRTDDWGGLPKPDRVLWLTVARMLAESKETAKLIREASHKALYERGNHFYRGKFFELLRPLGDVSLKYFAPTFDSIAASAPDERAPLSDKSLRVILDTVEWPTDKTDPIAAAKGIQRSRDRSDADLSLSCPWELSRSCRRNERRIARSERALAQRMAEVAGPKRRPAEAGSLVTNLRRSRP